MRKRIPPAFIDELLARTDIVALIDSRLPLRKAGHEFVACCPFHNEKTPSFTVSPQKQFYHCFGCGAHGTAIGFLMEFDRCSFIEAVEDLARETGLALPQEASEAQQERHQTVYQALEDAAGFYHRQLQACAEQGQVRAYLRKRGLSDGIVAEFALGFAPPHWDALLGHMPASCHTQLQAAGLVVQKEGDRCYDRFRNRLMFPIHDHRGRVIGFGGRLLGEGTPKYLNSPETPLFHKGRELYGLYQARQALRHCDRLLVVEGYMDVLALAQHGIRYAVATLGTATTPDHLTRLFRMTSVVVFCFDGDRAGSQAAWRALETSLPLLRPGRQVQFMFLPQGEDPDTLVRAEGRESFEARLEQATFLSDFLLERLQQKVNPSSIDGRARLLELARPLVSKIPPGVYRDMLCSRFAEMAQVEAATLARHLGSERTPPAVASRRRADPNMASPVRKAVAILLQRPGLMQRVDAGFSLPQLEDVGVGLLTELLELLRVNPDLNTAALLERWRDSQMGRYLVRLAGLELHLTDEEMELELQGALDWIQTQAAKLAASQRLAVLSSKSLEHLTTAEKQELALLTAKQGTFMR
jgi:DNA primase